MDIDKKINNFIDQFNSNRLVQTFACFDIYCRKNYKGMNFTRLLNNAL